MKSFSHLGFEVEITKDGSPSLRIRNGTLTGEAMHHSGGAYSETNLIYGEPIRHVLSKLRGGSFLIVGLGLGYIEMLLARECLSLGILSSEVNLISFESVSELILNFKQWLQKSEDDNSVYDDVAKSIIKNTEISQFQLKNYLLELYEGPSKILSALNRENLEKLNLPDSSLSRDGYNCILFDAFSAKTSPDLWDENFLIYFLDLMASSNCIFSTYACRGALKRALIETQFIVQHLNGFMGKRNSTRAIKGQLFSDPLLHP